MATQCVKNFCPVPYTSWTMHMFGLKQAVVDGKHNVLHNLQCFVALYASWTMHMFSLKQAVVDGKYNVLHNLHCMYVCMLYSI